MADVWTRPKTTLELAVQAAEEYTPGSLATHRGLRNIYLDAFATQITWYKADRQISSDESLTERDWRSIKTFGHDAGMKAVEKATQNKLKPRSTFQLWVNQGYREAFTLAVIGDDALIEYTMPRGSTALRIVDAFTWDGHKVVSYRAIPQKWLEAMENEGTDMLLMGNAQTH
jgi:hypothetical protein